MKTSTTELRCPACGHRFTAKWDGKDIHRLGPLADENRLVMETTFYTECPECAFQILVRKDIGGYDRIDKYGRFIIDADVISQF